MLDSETMVPMLIRCRRAMAASGTRAMPSSPIDDAPILGVRVERRAAVHDEVERELPFGVRRAPDTRACSRISREQRVGPEAAAERASDEMLDEDVLRAQ